MLERETYRRGQELWLAIALGQRGALARRQPRLEARGSLGVLPKGVVPVRVATTGPEALRTKEAGALPGGLSERILTIMIWTLNLAPLGRC